MGCCNLEPFRLEDNSKYLLSLMRMRQAETEEKQCLSPRAPNFFRTQIFTQFLLLTSKDHSKKAIFLAKLWNALKHIANNF